MLHFLFKDQTPVANWGGRMGAALAHVLVYKGAGIASLAIGIIIGAIGLNLIYGKRVVPLLRYMRWLSILLLLMAPILAYIFPEATFKLGGALGKVAIAYFNGLLGFAGTGMVLLAIVFFFVIVIFALDIKPFLNRMRAHAKKMAANMAPEPVFNDPAAVTDAIKNEAIQQENEEDESVPFITDHSANQLNNDGDMPALIVNELTNNKEWDMTVTERQAALQEEEENMQEEEEEIEEEDSEFEEYQKFNEDRNAAMAAHPHTADVVEEDAGFSYVVKQVEEPMIKHGAHISIADNEPYAPEESLRNYKFPTLDLLEDRVQEAISLNKEELERKQRSDHLYTQEFWHRDQDHYSYCRAYRNAL